MLGIQTQVLMLEQKAFYHWAIFPVPSRSPSSHKAVVSTLEDLFVAYPIINRSHVDRAHMGVPGGLFSHQQKAAQPNSAYVLPLQQHLCWH